MCMRMFVGVLSAATWLLAATVGSGGEPGGDEELIQGTWVCIAALKDGKETDQFVGVRAVMRGNRLTWSFPSRDGSTRTEIASFTLDTTQNPKHFDWNSETKPGENHKRLYVLRGDVLLWSTNIGAQRSIRPETFKAGQWLFVMKRVAAGQ